MLSIPRDSVVPVAVLPARGGRSRPGGPAWPGRADQRHLRRRRPGCLWKTVEQTTHLHLDHFIELNFTGFEKVINDIGGVSICLPFAVNDPHSKLHLSAAGTTSAARKRWPSGGHATSARARTCSASAGTST